MTPWDSLAKEITALKDVQDGNPVAREATVFATAPLSLLFDTDTEPTLAYGSLVAGLLPGDRVLTLQLRHYVWVLGMKGGVRDTGWVDLSSYLKGGSSGFSGVVRGRVLGDQVALSGAITGSIPQGGTTVDFLNAIPSQFRPSDRTWFDSAWRSGYTGNVVVRTDGTAGIAQRTVDWSGAEFSASYPRA